MINLLSSSYKESILSSYDKINVLSTFEAIRTRSSMYIGATDTPMQLFYEVFTNALDEAINGHVKRIDIAICNKTNRLVIRDDGRGFPLGEHPDYPGLYHLDVALTISHSGSKFNKESYLTSGGLHGLGLVCCTALSDSIIVTSIRDDKLTRVEYTEGIRVNGHILTQSVCSFSNLTKGTEVSFIPSDKYFRSVKWDKEQIISRVKLAKLYIPKVKIYFEDEEIKAYELSELAPKCDDQLFDISCITKEGESARVIFGYSLTRTDRDFNRGAVNLLSVDNGVHIRIFERAVIDAWTEVVDRDVKDYLNYNDYTLGISGFILVNLLEPSYTSQTKETLAGSVVDYKSLSVTLKTAITRELKKRLDTKFVQALLHRFRDYRKSLNEMSSSKYIDELVKYGEVQEGQVTRSSSLESKLVDCKSTDRDSTELFIVEGNSAGGGLISQRDVKTQAVLPLRGKTLNVIDQDLQRILNNLEIRSLVNALGAGVRHKELPDKVRYGKIIIASDSDIDGLSIQALLIGALCYLTPGIVKLGRLYVAEAPLFGQRDRRNRFVPIWDQKDLKSGLQTFRYKGLGSMDSDELKEVLLNPKTRRIKQLTLDDLNQVLKIVGHSGYKREMLIERGLLK